MAVVVTVKHDAGCVADGRVLMVVMAAVATALLEVTVEMVLMEVVAFVTALLEGLVDLTSMEATRELEISMKVTIVWIDENIFAIIVDVINVPGCFILKLI